MRIWLELRQQKALAETIRNLGFHESFAADLYLVRPLAGKAPMKAGDRKDAVRAEYDAMASRYDQQWGLYVRTSTEATLRRITLHPGARVLDVGCGTGLLLSRLLESQPTTRVAGVDLSAAMLSQARRRLPRAVPLLAGDAESLPFAAHSFDVVVSASSFHYWPRPSRGLAELQRILRPGGQLVITDWCDDYLACRVTGQLLRLINPAHRRIYGRRECRLLLDEASFEITGVERYRISWLWGLMTAIARAPAA